MKSNIKNNKFKKTRIVNQITKNILEKSYDTTAIVFITLAFFGKTGIKIFLKPSYYVDDPSEFLGEINVFKQQRLEKSQTKQTILRLQKYGLVRQESKKYLLTLKGKKLAEKILGYKNNIEKKWDGRYRLVIFDIPEVDRVHRNWLRRELYFLGYTKLQNSVFISKVSLTEDIIREIKERGIESGVNYLLVEHVYDLKKEKMNTKIK